MSVFGGTGPIGGEIITELVCRGYAVTAFLPDHRDVPDAWGEAVQVITGDLGDPMAVDTAVAPADAVINALDPRRTRPGRRPPLVEATTTIVAGMHRHGIRRYIGLGTPAVTVCPREQPTARIRWHRFLLRCLQPGTFRQMAGMLHVVTATELEWTIVRFLHANTRGARGLKHVGHFGPDPVGASATAADIARFAVTQILDTTYIGTAPAVSN
ncbi:NAD(P)-dependent oxidoreductase [Kocuria arenosa]|uniref:NAD(P)-dependent oxidoreductase n=1 Tax=Kocuria arenosa TaxID=3071446 RepID=UPI0034D4B3A3